MLARWRRLLAHPQGWPTLAGLGLGLLALGPALAPGYVLSYDMVFLPHPPISAATIGLSGGPPRAVPSDAVIAVLSAPVPADLLQKIILVGIFAASCAGAARLLGRCTARTGRNAPLVARLAAGMFYAWNPFVAERLILGQWALLLGYAGLPWVVGSVWTGDRPVRLGRLAAALIPAAVGGFAAVGISALAAVPVAAAGSGPGRGRRLALVLGALGVASLPWLIPALLVGVHTDPQGADAFAARPDTPFGRVGSLLMLGGVWNQQVVPRGYGGAGSAAWLVVILVAVAGYGLLGWRARACPGLGSAGVVGFAVAAIGVTAPSRMALRHLIAAWPGFAVLRDGQHYAAPLALTESIGIGLVAVWLTTDLVASFAREPTPGRQPPAGGTDPASTGLVTGATGRPDADQSRETDRDRETGYGRETDRSRETDRGGETGYGRELDRRGETGRNREGGAHGPAARRAAMALAIMAAIAPVLLLPGLAWGAAGRLHAATYPADWLRARQIIDGDPRLGSVALLPWAAYRRFGWNDGGAVLDPWTKLLRRPVIWNDALRVGDQTVAAEDPAARRLNAAISAAGPLTRAMRSAGVRYVIVDAGPLLRGSPRGRSEMSEPSTGRAGFSRAGFSLASANRAGRADAGRAGSCLAEEARLPGATVLLASGDLVVFRLPTGTAIPVRTGPAKGLLCSATGR